MESTSAYSFGLSLPSSIIKRGQTEGSCLSPVATVYETNGSGISISVIRIVRFEDDIYRSSSYISEIAILTEFTGLCNYTF
jgi:hypothetical protein